MFDVKRLESDRDFARVALVVPKFGYTAVRRNLLKRRMRELTREIVLPGDARDVLFRAKRVAYDASFDELKDEVRRIADVILSEAKDPS